MKKEKFDLEKNVLEFIDWVAKEVGKAEEESFNYDAFSECCDLEMESPIEQILYVALKAMQRLNPLFVEEDDIEKGPDGKERVIGLAVYPQYKIGKFRVDFLVGYGIYRLSKTYEWNEVVVECDSQQFHERTERERRYEKARDRFLQASGYKVFRFTGAEIVREPMRVGAEIVSYLTKTDMEHLLQDFNTE